MAQEFLLRSDVEASFDQVRGEGMAETRCQRQSFRAFTSGRAPYMIEAMSHLSPVKLGGTDFTSSRVMTTDSRVGLRALNLIYFLSDPI